MASNVDIINMSEMLYRSIHSEDMTLTKKIAILLTILITDAQCIQVVDKKNFHPTANTTTLYPVINNVFKKSNTEKDDDNKHINSNSDVTTWKINATLALPIDISEEEETDKSITNEKRNKSKNSKDNSDTFKPNSFSFPKDVDKSNLRKAKNNTITDEYSVSENKDKDKRKNSKEGKEFKPSPHLNSYYDTIDDSPPRNLPSFSSPVKNSPFYYEQDNFKQTNKIPQDFVAFPYSYENNFSPHKNSAQGLQSKPTDESPVRIPAGGLYRHPDVLKGKPDFSENDHFSIDVNDSERFKENSLKKRSNPWKGILRLATALIPAGLIVSALTPNIITLQNVDTSPDHYKRVSRRSDHPPSIPVVSEQCKRRLLCEIHSDRHYVDNGSPYHRPKHCYKIHCEDPQAVSMMLHWLLTYHRSGDSRGRDHT